jgi:hypothetical protein
MRRSASVSFDEDLEQRVQILILKQLHIRRRTGIDQQSKSSVKERSRWRVNCEKVVADLFAAWTRLSLDEVMSYFAEDAVWHR